MLNKVMLIGRLGRDPDIRYTQAGMPIANLNIATDESYTDRDGIKQDRTEWHRVVVFQKLAENCKNYLVKGSLVYVEGSLQTRKWTDQQGQDRYVTEIKAQRVQFLDRKGDRPSSGEDEFPMQENPTKNKRQSMDDGDYGDWNGGPKKKGSSRDSAGMSEEDFGSPAPSESSSMDNFVF